MSRLASHVRVGAIRRLAEAEGGMATIVARGDADAGDILLIVEDRTTPDRVRFYTRIPGYLREKGAPIWQETAAAMARDRWQHIDSKDKIADMLARRRKIDPDLWMVELNVADWERFAGKIAELD